VAVNSKDIAPSETSYAQLGNGMGGGATRREDCEVIVPFAAQRIELRLDGVSGFLAIV
jgi:hypothetical protein